ncbi:Flagellar protein FlhE [Enterobacter hormaechei]|nr:Flagellar protein FlhE [Enterobacter hormaechei]
MRKWLWILLFPLAAQAAGEGAWQASSIGLTLNHRGSRSPPVRCPPLSPCPGR